MGLTELVRLAVGIDGNWSGFLHQWAVLVRIPAGDGGIGQIFFESCGKKKKKKQSHNSSHKYFNPERIVFAF